MSVLTFLLGCSILCGCVQVGPKDIPINNCPKLSVPECPKTECPKSVELPPLDNQIHIKIDGNKIEADAGGEKLIRNYVYARELLRSR
jgi:hypothetical protein